MKGSQRELAHRYRMEVIDMRAWAAGADIVGFNPRQDTAGITAPVCTKLVKELAARMIVGPRYDEASGTGFA